MAFQLWSHKVLRARQPRSTRTGGARRDPSEQSGRRARRPASILIVANPPYVAQRRHRRPSRTRSGTTTRASRSTAGPDGLDAYRALAAPGRAAAGALGAVLRSKSAPARTAAVAALAAASGLDRSRDASRLAGVERVVLGGAPVARSSTARAETPLASAARARQNRPPNRFQRSAPCRHRKTDDQPRGDLTVRLTAMPADTNANGDIFGGWVLRQMDQAGGIAARDARRAGWRRSRSTR